VERNQDKKQGHPITIQTDKNAKTVGGGKPHSPHRTSNQGITSVCEKLTQGEISNATPWAAFQTPELGGKKG